LKEKLLERDGAAKVDTDRGGELYPHCMKLVELVFASIRTKKQLNHFTLREKITVKIRWLLYCRVDTIGKTGNYGPAFADG